MTGVCLRLTALGLVCEDFDFGIATRCFVGKFCVEYFGLSTTCWSKKRKKAWRLHAKVIDKDQRRDLRHLCGSFAVTYTLKI